MDLLGFFIFSVFEKVDVLGCDIDFIVGFN